MEEAAHLSKVFQADFTHCHTSNGSSEQLLTEINENEKTNGPRLQLFLQQMEGMETFNEILIVVSDHDLEEFETKKQSFG